MGDAVPGPPVQTKVVPLSFDVLTAERTVWIRWACSSPSLARRRRIGRATLDRQAPGGNARGQRVLLEFRLLHQPVRHAAQQFSLGTAALMTARP